MDSSKRGGRPSPKKEKKARAGKQDSLNREDPVSERTRNAGSIVRPPKYQLKRRRSENLSFVGKTKQIPCPAEGDDEINLDRKDKPLNAPPLVKRRAKGRPEDQPQQHNGAGEKQVGETQHDGAVQVRNRLKDDSGDVECKAKALRDADKEGCKTPRNDPSTGEKSTRRTSSRKRRRISRFGYGEKDLQCGDQVERQNTLNNDNVDDKEHESDLDDWLPEVPQEKIRNIAPKQSNTKRGESGFKPKCPYCDKTMSTEASLKYHLDRFVCRPNESSRPNLSPSERPKKAKIRANKKSSRVRGKLEDRICPHCKREFSSVLGLTYHIKHLVCQQPSKKKCSNKEPYHLLKPGEQFVTSYGVVEVVKDDRMIPTATLPSKIKSIYAHWQRSKTRKEELQMKSFAAVAGPLQLRRAKVNALFKTGPVTSNTMFKAYFDGHPQYIPKPEPLRPKHKPLPEDPTAPEGSYPDRIVECVSLADNRARYNGLPCKREPIRLEQPDKSTSSRMKLYLRRKLLTEPYDPSKPQYVCEDCGYGFNSSQGLKFHMENRVCANKVGQATKARQKLAAMVEKVAAAAATPRLKSKRRKGVEMGLYPEVLLSLGFNLVTRDIDDDNDATSGADTAIDNDVLDPPDALLADLKVRLKEHQREADDQRYGSMYVEVYKSLGFQKPKKRKKKVESDEERTGKRRRRKRAKKIKPLPPPRPPPPTIDSRALVDEVKSGRYPSIRRYKGNDHGDVCFICSKVGELFCCDFCPKAVHWACVLTKFTLKAPEPDEDFMCHRCIQYILQRRARAEKRRLEKEAQEAKRQQEEAIVESEQKPQIEEGKEYHFLAQQAQETSDILELLQDTRFRLLQSMETNKINDVRRMIMDT